MSMDKLQAYQLFKADKVEEQKAESPNYINETHWDLYFTSYFYALGTHVNTSSDAIQTLGPNYWEFRQEHSAALLYRACIL